MKSLGLTGKEQYLIVKAIEGKLFSFHLEFVINDRNAVWISFSNIYKEKKSVSGTSI